MNRWQGVRSQGARSLALSVMLLACTSVDGPAEPVWGREACANCAMLLSDRRHAAQLRAPDGEAKFFDDLGCAILWLQKHKGTYRVYVRTTDGTQWTDARTAHFRSGAKTPMDFGFETATTGRTWDELLHAVAPPQALSTSPSSVASVPPPPSHARAMDVAGQEKGDSP